MVNVIFPQSIYNSLRRSIPAAPITKLNIHDPNEDYNIQENNPQKILELEKILQEILKDTSILNTENDQESEEIAKELRKLGYF